MLARNLLYECRLKLFSPEIYDNQIEIQILSKIFKLVRQFVVIQIYPVLGPVRSIFDEKQVNIRTILSANRFKVSVVASEDCSNCFSSRIVV